MGFAYYSFFLFVIAVFSQVNGQIQYRLPTNARPNNYVVDLTLQNNVFETNVFSGVATVQFSIEQETQEIILQANGLTITETVLRAPGALILTEPLRLNTTNDFLTVRANTLLAVLATGQYYSLTFTYTGVLRDTEMYGLYKSSYVDETGTTKYLATTQFQPTHARKVFPCFDEPSFKATFTISVTHPSIYTAVGNMLGTEAPSGALTKTSFATTPVMSTYLIALVVSDFTCTENAIYPGVPGMLHRICSRQGASSTRALALDLGPRLLQVYDSYTGIPYIEPQMRKLDQFAIPDFAAGAMENWGLITYRETALLWDENESSTTYKQRVATVVAHELAHMWFGNLITTHWWSDTFLNEGFATYFEFFATAQVLPEWKLDYQIVVEDVQAVFQTDASPNAQPLSFEANSPAEISNRFGTISYSKGGSIFRMVENFMGSSNFQSGIRHYLNSSYVTKYQNTVPTDLWTALDFHTGDVLPSTALTLGEVMENWITRPGFPLVSVTLRGNDIVLKQERFLSSGEPQPDEKWFVPISFTHSSDANKFENTGPQAWLLPTEDETVIPNVTLNGSEWIVVNNQETGYYRVDYSDDLWERIRVALQTPNFGGIHVLNRAQIVDDLWNLARVGRKPYGLVLNTIWFLSNDVDYFTWYSAFVGFNQIWQRIGSPEIREAYASYILTLTDKLRQSVPYDVVNENEHIYTLNQVLAQTWACRLDAQECVDHTLNDFRIYKITKDFQAPIKPNKNLRNTVYCTALRNSEDPSDWDFLWEEFLRSTLSSEQVTILSALGCARDPEILRSYLLKSINETSGIRRQDALSVFSAVYSGNPEGVDLALDFLIQNFDQIEGYYASMNSITNMISGLAGRFTTETQVLLLENFVNGRLDGALLTSATTSIQSARNNLIWTRTLEQELREFFLPVPESDSGNLTSINLAVLATTLLVFLFRFL